MRKGSFASLGREGSESSSVLRSVLRDERQACDRALSRDSGLLLSERVSGEA